MLKIKGVNFYPQQLESILMKHKEIGNHYQIVLEKTRGRDNITVMIETQVEIESSLEKRLIPRFMICLDSMLTSWIFCPEEPFPEVLVKRWRVVDKRE